MDLQKLLSVNIVALAALGTLLLAMGQSSPWSAMTLWMVAVVSLVVNDFTGWFRLNRNVATVAALAILAIFLRMCIRYEGEARMLAMADMLIYLQIVLLFQEKDARVYWWLAVMSLLQVVVAAGFSQGIAFGALLVVYMLVGLCGLTLLLLYSEWNRHRTGENRRARQRPPAVAGLWPTENTASPAQPSGDSRTGLVGELFAPARAHRRRNLGSYAGDLLHGSTPGPAGLARRVVHSPVRGRLLDKVNLGEMARSSKDATRSCASSCSIRLPAGRYPRWTNSICAEQSQSVTGTMNGRRRRTTSISLDSSRREESTRATAARSFPLRQGNCRWLASDSPLAGCIFVPIASQRPGVSRQLDEDVARATQLGEPAGRFAADHHGAVGPR